MNSQTSTRVVTHTGTRAQLRPVAAEDYFSYRPSLTSNRGRYPPPLLLSNKEPCGPLAAGPREWKYTKLSTRSPALESCRDDHGVRFKLRVTVRDVLLGCKWHKLLDEDAPPYRAKDHCLKYLEVTYKSSKECMAKCGRRLRDFWTWLWQQLVFMPPELEESNNDALYIYWEDIEPGIMFDTEDVQHLLGHTI